MKQIPTKKIIELFHTPSSCIALTAAEWSQFIFILRSASLLARFYYLAHQHECYDDFPDKVKHHLHSSYIKAERQAKQAQFEAFEMNNNLSEINVKPIFLKGVAYTLLNSTASHGRIYSDMDILVPREQLQNIERKLSLYGWFGKEVDDYDQKYYRQWAHEIPPMQQSSRGTVADIHHNLLPPISGRAPKIEIFTINLFKTEDGFYVLNKPSMVMHSIIHLFFNEEYSNGFRDLSDLDLMFKEEIDNENFWCELLTLSQNGNFETELFYAIRYCQKIFKTDFSDNFMESLSKPKGPRLKLADFIFTRVLLPQHPSCSDRFSGIANIIASIRGHMLKMPIHILIYHSVHKLLDSIKEMNQKDNSINKNSPHI